MRMANKNLRLVSVVLSLSVYHSFSQQPPPPNATCNDIFVSYAYTGGFPIPPTDPTNQAYRFESTLTVLNNGRDELQSWRVFVGFQYSELLVSANGAVLADAAALPASVGNGAVFVGQPRADLKSAIETAGDVTQTAARIQLVGTRFGNGNLNAVLPANLSLRNDGYSCPPPTSQGNELNVCCIKSAASIGIIAQPNFLARQDGDLIIMYDIMSTYDANYWAQVTISNHNPLGRLDNWKLSWDWTRGEFIYAMKGGYPYVVDTTDCIFGQQGQHYKDLDFSQALNCQRRPTIIDLPPTRANDTNLGRIPFCCRNGTILPPNMDPSKSISIFQMQVYKMPPNLNRTDLVPPENWKIDSGGTFNSNFHCGSPVPVTPSQFPDPSGLPAENTAFASWQVICNIVHSKDDRPKCCVSFSAFFNDSIVPCNTCACGCNSNQGQTCSVHEPALLLPTENLIVPFENRTVKTLEWAVKKGVTVPNPLPCGDNCGVSINWHLLSDYRGGWTARISLFNWGETNFPDWFAAVQLDKATPGLEKIYSFNGTALPDSNNTIIMQGFPELNYLLAEKDGANPSKDPWLPGMQQSVISFSKKQTPGIDVTSGDGFPTKVVFNGDECALPLIRPTNNGHKANAAVSVFGLLALLAVLSL